MSNFPVEQIIPKLFVTGQGPQPLFMLSMTGILLEPASLLVTILEEQKIYVAEKVVLSPIRRSLTFAQRFTPDREYKC